MMDKQFVNVHWTAVMLSTVFITLGILPQSDSANNALQAPANANCVCPSEVLTFTCNVVGGGTTLWTGTAFSCGTLNEILLRHSQFPRPEGTSGSCNNGAIMGRSIGVINECYSSELNVTVSPGLSGRTIQCNYDSSGGPRTVGVSNLTVVTAMDPPSSIQLINLQNGQATLKWTAVDSCTPVGYIISSNCTTCNPTTTNQTTRTCPITEPTTDVLVCVFSVQSVVCDNLMGSSSTAVITLQTPSVNVIPFYSADDKSLSKFTIQGMNLTIASSDNTPLFIIQEYNVTYSDPTTGIVRDIVTVTTCGKDACDTDIKPSLVCPSSTITLTAYNGFRQRSLSDPVTIGCTNRFVDVRYDATASTVTCTFLNQMDTSIKSCHITFRECGQTWTQDIQGSSTIAAPNSITLRVMFSGGSFCYAATASSGNFTVVVEGSMQSMNNTAAIIAGIVVTALVFMIAVTIIILLSILWFRKPKGTHVRELHRFQEMSIIDKLKLKPITERKFKKHTIQSSCNLRDAIEFQMKAQFKRGHAYYEFTHRIENISKDKELIFMNEETETYFTPTAESSVLEHNGLLGEGVTKTSFKSYRVFVQSTGSGARHLPSGSNVLYEHTQEEKWRPENTPLVPLTSKHFVVSGVERDCTLNDFHKEKHVASKTFNTFLEYSNVDKSDIGRYGIRDVILMDKENKKSLFTGPAARSDPSAHMKDWRVFIMLKTVFDGKTVLKAGTDIIHQNLEYTQDRYHVLTVDEDNVQLSNFIENTFNVNFENGRAFYEFTHMEEDFLYYVEVVRMHKSIDKKYKEEQKEGKQQGEEQTQGKGSQEEELETGIKWFYWINSKTPGMGIKPQKYEDYKVFVQSTSQGSRCLKSKTLLLYKVQN